jgi:LysM repeat protein
MFSIRVTAPDGSSHTHPFAGAQCSIGRTANNDIVLEGPAVSSRHALLEVSPAGCVIKDRGSSNGTWLNNNRLEQPSTLGEGDRVYIGNFLIELTRMAPSPSAQPNFEPSPSVGGPLLREQGPLQKWREQHDGLRRNAREWDAKGRPDRLGLRPRELSKYRAWLTSTPPGHENEVGTLEREYIDASRRALGKKQMLRIVAGIGGVLAIGGLTTAAFFLWPRGSDDDQVASATDTETGEDSGDEREESGYFVEDDQGDLNGEDEDAIVGGPLEHTVIPKETLADIADRYGVGEDDLVDWNLLNPDTPLSEGQVLKIEKPAKRPLPQQKVTYEVDPGETWTAVAERFGVAVTDLRGYNEGVEKIAAGTKLAVWIDPKPYKPRDPPMPIPEFHIDKRAVSIGAPNAGKLVNGIQLPESDLYTRRYPHIMWGSSQTISNLQKAIAMFRRDVDYEDEIIVADISKKTGGHFNPHKSHQAGRDIDIWLPTLKGVYKRKYLEDDRKGRPYRPSFSEIDWYATWGLARALIQTGAVEEIFLDWTRQKYVYDAAVNMGATPEQLDEWIQYPRKQTSGKGIFRHSAKHYTHMHVRFKCAEWEDECRTKPVRP